MLPLALPGVVAGSIFTFSLTLGDYITPMLVGGGKHQFIGNVVDGAVGITDNVPFAAASRRAAAVMAVYLVVAPGSGRSRRSDKGAPAGTGSLSGPCWSWCFLWVPLGIILVYAFNSSNIQSWPIPSLTLKWFRVAWDDQEVRTR